MLIDEAIEILTEKATKLLLDKRVTFELKSEFINQLTQVREKAEELHRKTSISLESWEKGLKLRVLADFVFQAEEEVAIKRYGSRSVAQP